MTRLVEMIFKGEVLDRAACDAMLEILLKQQLNDRLPRFLAGGHAHRPQDRDVQRRAQR